MSPSANTSGWPGSVRSGSTSDAAGAVGLAARRVGEQARERRGRDAGRPDRVARRDARRLAVARRAPRPTCASTPTTVVLQQRRRAERRERLLGAVRASDSGNVPSSRSVASTSSTFALRVSAIAVVAVQRVARELGDLARHLDAGRAAADDDERQPRCARLRVVLDLGRLEGREDPRAQVERAGQRLQLRRVLGPVVVAEVRVRRAAGDDELVVLERCASFAAREVVDRDGARREVEAGHLGRARRARSLCRRRICRSGEAISTADSAPVATW